MTYGERDFAGQAKKWGYERKPLTFEIISKSRRDHYEPFDSLWAERYEKAEK